LKNFWNRIEELASIRDLAGRGLFGYVTGRRRVGKTALLVEICRILGGIYHQAVEGTPQQQIEHLVLELKERLPFFREIVPRSWPEFFHLLSQVTLPPVVVFDEFPYWAQADAVLPSILQKWIDHELPKKKTSLLISGSSQSMLHSYFLEGSSPLYGRAGLHLDLAPLSYRWFCRVFRLRTGSAVSFAKFSLVGGVPHYWKLMPRGSVDTIAEELYFKPSAPLADEPRYLLHDEGITGNIPKAILDLVGRGVAKPSEIAARLGTPQNNLSRPLVALMDAGLLVRELPFGESTNTTKRTLYSIQDPSISFYYGTTLPHRSRWSILNASQRKEILDRHISQQWEIFCRQAYTGSSRYWEANLEIDLVAPLKSGDSHLIAECKWTVLTESQEKSLLENLQRRFYSSRLAGKIQKPSFRILSKKNLQQLGALAG